MPDSIMVLQKFGGEPVPPDQVAALQAELASRAGKRLRGRGMNRAYDEPLEVTATPAAPPTRQAPKSKAIASRFAVSAYVSTFGVNDAGIEAAARRGACDTFEDFNGPTPAPSCPPFTRTTIGNPQLLHAALQGRAPDTLLGWYRVKEHGTALTAKALRDLTTPGEGVHEAIMDHHGPRPLVGPSSAARPTRLDPPPRVDPDPDTRNRHLHQQGDHTPLTTQVTEGPPGRPRPPRRMGANHRLTRDTALGTASHDAPEDDDPSADYSLRSSGSYASKAPNTKSFRLEELKMKSRCVVPSALHQMGLPSSVEEVVRPLKLDDPIATVLPKTTGICGRLPPSWSPQYPTQDCYGASIVVTC